MPNNIAINDSEDLITPDEFNDLDHDKNFDLLQQRITLENSNQKFIPASLKADLLKRNELNLSKRKTENSSILKKLLLDPVSSKKLIASSKILKKPARSIINFQMIVNHDHHYANNPQVTLKKLKLLKEKYMASESQVLLLRKQVNLMRVTIDSLKKEITYLKSNKSCYQIY